MARLICPSCNATLQFGVDPTGKRVRCRGCGHRFVAAAEGGAPSPAGVPKARSDQKWFLAVGGKTSGPYSVDELRGFIGEGRVTAKSKVCPVGGKQWASVSATLPELLESPSSVPPPPPPDEEDPPMPGPRRERSAVGGSAPVGAWQIHPQRKFAAIAAGVGVVSVFLPWAHAPIVGSVQGVDGEDGWIVLGLFVVALAVLLAKERHRLPSKAQALWASIPSALAGLAVLYDMSSLKERLAHVGKQGMFGEMAAASVRIGIGLYIGIAAGIAVPVILYILGPKLLGGTAGTPSETLTKRMKGEE